MDPELYEQLAVLQDGQEAIVRRLDQMNGTVSDVLLEIGGVPHRTYREPDRKTIRRRLHDLENDAVAAQIAHAALESAQRLHVDATERRFTKREKIAALLCAAIVAAGPFVAPLFYHA